MAKPQGFVRSFRPYTDTLRSGVSTWLQEKGKPILQAQQRIMAQTLPSIVGDAALQVSVGTPIDLLKPANMPLQWLLSREQGGHVQADPCYLPFMRRSLDLVVLHHSLDFEDDPHKVLHGAVSALTAGGTLIVIGFHPLSLYGFSRWAKIWRQPIPWQGRFIRPKKVAEWLWVLNCEVERVESACYGGPNYIDQGIWHGLGERFWPKHGAFYLLVARKQTALMRPLPDNAAKATATPSMVGIGLACTAEQNSHNASKSE